MRSHDAKFIQMLDWEWVDQIFTNENFQLHSNLSLFAVCDVYVNKSIEWDDIKFTVHRWRWVQQYYRFSYMQPILFNVSTEKWTSVDVKRLILQLQLNSEFDVDHVVMMMARALNHQDLHTYQQTNQQTNKSPGQPTSEPNKHQPTTIIFDDYSQNFLDALWSNKYVCVSAENLKRCVIS